MIWHYRNARGREWIAAFDSLQSGKATEGRGSREVRKGGGERSKRREEREEEGVVEMRVAAPFFTADKNICLDINLERRSSLPPLPHHPSYFREPTTPLLPPYSSSPLTHTMFHLSPPPPRTLPSPIDPDSTELKGKEWRKKLGLMCGKKRKRMSVHVCEGGGLRGGAERFPQRSWPPVSWH